MELVVMTILAAMLINSLATDAPAAAKDFHFLARSSAQPAPWRLMAERATATKAVIQLAAQ